MYANNEDLIKRFGLETLQRLTSYDEEDIASFNAALTTALTDATNLIDSYLRAKYALPLSSESETVKRCCVDLAFYNLHTNSPTELTEKRYEDWMKWLQLVAKGTVLLDIVPDMPADGSGVTVADGGLVQFGNTRPGIFGGAY